MTTAANGAASGREFDGLATRADLLLRIVSEGLDTARPALASNARTARLALDELRALVPACHGTCHGTSNARRHQRASVNVRGSDADARESRNVEEFARQAGLAEFDALDFRRKSGQEMTELELQSWRRIEHFAALVTAAAAGAKHQPSGTAGTGPVDAS